MVTFGGTTFGKFALLFNLAFGHSGCGIQLMFLACGWLPCGTSTTNSECRNFTSSQCIKVQRAFDDDDAQTFKTFLKKSFE